MAQPVEALPARSGDGWLRALLLLGGLIAVGYAARNADLSPAALRAHGAAGLVAAGALACALGLPRQAVAFAGGYTFGFWPGLGLAMLAQLGGCAADFTWARLVAGDWARARLAGRWARLDRFLAANPFTATLTLRLSPISSNLVVNLLAGASGLPARSFFAATAIGYLPQTIVFALLGAGVQVGRAAQLGLGVALFAASGVLGLVLLRRTRYSS